MTYIGPPNSSRRNHFWQKSRSSFPLPFSPLLSFFSFFFHPHPCHHPSSLFPFPHPSFLESLIASQRKYRFCNSPLCSLLSAILRFYANLRTCQVDIHIKWYKFLVFTIRSSLRRDFSNPGENLISTRFSSVEGSMTKRKCDTKNMILETWCYFCREKYELWQYGFSWLGKMLK